MTEYILKNEEAEDDILRLDAIGTIALRDRHFEDGYGNKYTTKHAFFYDESIDKLFVKATLETEEMNLAAQSELSPREISLAIRNSIFHPEHDLEEHEYLAPKIKESFESLVNSASKQYDLLPLSVSLKPIFAQVLLDNVPVAILTDVEMRVSKESNNLLVAKPYPLSILDEIAGKQVKVQVAVGSHFVSGEALADGENAEIDFHIDGEYNKSSFEVPSFNVLDDTDDAFYEERLNYLTQHQNKALSEPNMDQFDSLLDDLL